MQLGDEVLHARAPVPPVLSHPVLVLVTLKQEAVVVWVSCVLAAGSAVAGRQEVDRPRKGASGSSPQHAAPVLHPRHPAPRPLSSSPRRRTGPHNNAYHPPLLQTPPSPTGEVEVEQGGGHARVHLWALLWRGLEAVGARVGRGHSGRIVLPPCTGVFKLCKLKKKKLNTFSI